MVIPLKKPIAALCFWLIFLSMSAQTIEEISPPDHIKTVEFWDSQSRNFPVVEPQGSVVLEFDDLSAVEKDYYYEITHHNADWQISRLLKTEYLNGNDRLRITQYTNSSGTLVPYNHFRLSLPNAQTQFKHSGNYLITIYEGSGKAVFSRRFAVVDPQTSAQISIKRSRDMSQINTHQWIQFSVSNAGISAQNPNTQIKTVLLQNDRWDRAIYGLKPQFNNGKQWIYRYGAASGFPGGNEYRYFDTAQLRSSNNAVQRIELQDIYHHYLFADVPRYNRPYTLFPDLNGRFAVRSQGSDTPQREADYTWVHFSLSAPQNQSGDQIFLIGGFNQFQITPEYRLVYQESTQRYEGAFLMKQGFYNYSYVLVDAQGKKGEETVDGSFHLTENQYTVLTYFRPLGAVADQLIGIGTAQGFAVDP